MPLMSAVGVDGYFRLAAVIVMTPSYLTAGVRVHSRQSASTRIIIIEPVQRGMEATRTVNMAPIFKSCKRSERPDKRRLHGRVLAHQKGGPFENWRANALSARLLKAILSR